MAWWDHEELKSRVDRSTRYKFDFSEEYTKDELIEEIQIVMNCDWARERHGENAMNIAKKLNYKPKIRVRAKYSENIA